MKKARLKELYETTIRQSLKQELGIKNVMQIPRLQKVVLNVGVKEAISDSKVLQKVEDVVKAISGQSPVRTKAKKSIAGFKLREGMPIGVMVTLRGNEMYNFLDKLFNLALPKTRDFQGITTKFDGRGNYNLGIKEWVIFPEIEYGVDMTHGLNISIHTSTDNDEYGRTLLRHFGAPFRKA